MSSAQHELIYLYIHNTLRYDTLHYIKPIFNIYQKLNPKSKAKLKTRVQFSVTGQRFANMKVLLLMFYG